MKNKTPSICFRTSLLYNTYFIIHQYLFSIIILLPSVFWFGLACIATACHCLLAVETPIVVESQDPCVPSPCGPNAVCRSRGNTPTCSCLPSYIGRPPNCRPECTNNAECPGHLACQNEKCRDPCPGSCGLHTTCVVIKHSPVCSCLEGFTGDPFNGCSVVLQGSSTCVLSGLLIQINPAS